MTTTSYWLDPAHPLAGPLQGDVTADVVVVGAGLCGVAAARALAHQGVDVVLLEAGRVASAATGRNAGFILQGTAERYSRAIEMLGHDRCRRIHAWSLQNHDRIAAVIDEEGIACGYRRGGSLQLASSEGEEAELATSAALLQADGFEAELVEGEALPAVFREAGFRTGVRLPRDGELDPVRFVRAAAVSARRAGARLYEQCPVLSLDASTGGAVTVTTAGGRVSAQAVVVAVNARVGQLLPWFADKVDPVRGQMLATGPAPRLFDTPIYADHGFDYWRQDERGCVVLGGWRNLDPGSEVGFDDHLHPEIQARMEAFIRRFPALAEVPITHRWSGIMGFSRDGLPILGPVPGSPGAVAGAGFTGHGFGFAWLAGEALATVILEGSHPFVTELGARRFTP
jgi:gamma-glutamylputrescine oxidase